MTRTPECVLIGLATEPLDRLLTLAKASEGRSAGYAHLIANSARFMGKRSDYFEVINSAITTATGRPSHLHYANIPNLAALLLATFLDRRGISTEIINYFNAEKDRFADILATSPRLVAITTTFYVDNGPIKSIVEFVRQHSPTTKIVVGGPRMFHLFSDYPQEVMLRTLLKDIGADYYVNDSQGELTLSRLCQELAKASPNVELVPNIAYIDAGGQLHQTERIAENNDMNELGVGWAKYLRDHPARTVTTRTARSCAFKCAFCRYPLIAGSLDLTGIDVVERELNEIQKAGSRVVMFIDDTFNIPKPRFKDLCRMLIKNKYDFNWISYFRCANADDEVFDLLAEAGCVGVFLGIESGDQTVLKAMNKGASVERYQEGIAKLNERNIMTYATFITGFPAETDETVKNTINFIRETRPTFYSMEPYYHDPKVPIASKADQYGLKGAGYSWSHNTMDWRQATEWAMTAYETIEESTVLPLNNFDLWSIGYMMGEGFERDQTCDALTIMSRMLIGGLRDPDRSFPELEQKLVDLFSPQTRSS